MIPSPTRWVGVLASAGPRRTCGSGPGGARPWRERAALVGLPVAPLPSWSHARSRRWPARAGHWALVGTTSAHLAGASATKPLAALFGPTAPGLRQIARPQRSPVFSPDWWTASAERWCGRERRPRASPRVGRSRIAGHRRALPATDAAMGDSCHAPSLSVDPGCPRTANARPSYGWERPRPPASLPLPT